MAREIVHVQVGQCGNQMGLAFWDTVRQEHLLRNDSEWDGDRTNQDDVVKLDKIGVYFQQSGDKRYTPRAVLVDLEPSTLDTIKGSNIGKMFKPDCFVFGSSGAGNNWAKGHYTDGAELNDEVIDVVRKEVEACDCLQGIQMTHSLGGGTGSGLGTLLLTKIRDDYPDRITCTYSVYPSELVSDVVVEPYNAVLTIDQLLENSDETFTIDNEALYHISHNLLKQEHPKFADLNWVISLSMSGITSSLRFSGQLNGDLRKLGVNLIPFPRVHFFTLTQAPLFPKEHAKHFSLNVSEVTEQMLSATNTNGLANIHPDDGKYLSVAFIYRGNNIPTSDVGYEMAVIQGKYNYRFVNWIPNNIKWSIINVPPNHVPISGTFVGNTTALSSVFERIAEQFAKMYKRKAYLHWYTGEGMDEMQFQEADKNMRDLITEYQDKTVVDPGDPGDGDEDMDDDEEEE